MINLTNNNFENEVLRSEIPVFVDFWSECCFQCIAVEPTLEKLEEKYKGKIKFAKANVSDIGGWATAYGIMSLPTMIIFKIGGIVHQFIGNQPIDVFEKELNKL